MQLDTKTTVQGPRGAAISLSVSQTGDIYAGWSTGGVLKLPYGADSFRSYVKGSMKRSPTYARRTPRSKFIFLSPVAIDAWGSKHSQFIGDERLRRIYEVDSNKVKLIAGTGEDGSDDGDGLSEASFGHIRSIAVLPHRIAVLTDVSKGIYKVRVINRVTNQVSTIAVGDGKLSWGAIGLPRAGQSLTSSSLIRVAVSDWNAVSSHMISLNSEDEYEVSYDHNDKLTLFLAENPSTEVQVAESDPRTAWATGYALHCSLNGKTEIKHFVHFSDILPVYCPRSDSLVVFEGDKMISYGEILGMKEGVEPTGTFEFPDTSSLFASNGFLADLEIHHEHSNTRFQLHRSIINQDMQGRSAESPSEQLATFIRSSSLSPSVIQAFLEYRYFKPLHIESSLIVTFAWMSKTTFGQDDPSILHALRTRIDGEDAASACKLLIDTWMNSLGSFDLDESSLIVRILLEKAQTNRSSFKTALDLAVTTFNPLDLAKLFPRMSSLMAMVAGPDQTATLPDIEKPRRERFVPRDLASTEAFLSTYTTNVVLQLESFHAIGACGWLLYAHWPWFKSLIDSGLQESKTRIVSLPKDSFTFNALLMVLKMLQYGDMTMLESSYREDVVSLLKHAEAFGLVDADGRPLDRVKPLIEACVARIFPTPSIVNCWEQLQLAHSFNLSQLTKRLLHFVIDTVTHILPRDLAFLPDQVALDLIHMLRDKELANASQW